MSWLSAKRVWQLVALLAALAAGVSVFFVRAFTLSAPQGAGQAEVRATAYEAAGPSIIAVVALPILLAALPLFFRGRAWVITGYVSAVALTAYTVTGIMSVGLFFLPAALIAVVGAFLQPPEPGGR